MGAEDAADFKRRYGISDEFVDQVGKLINPGESAVFVLARTVDPDLVAEKFRGYGGRILRTNLTLEQRCERSARWAASVHPRSELAQGKPYSRSY